MNIMNTAIFGPAIADANCVYRILVTCQPAFTTFLQLSGSGNGVFGPPTNLPQREITCSTPGDPTGGYTFIDNAPSQQIVTSVFCT
uniref:Uncharacterized protein n=1 Tax=Panagrolaimus sp. PS1159 TaxID=55785 RepID=A0AC35FC60_9BILA